MLLLSSVQHVKPARMAIPVSPLEAPLSVLKDVLGNESQQAAASSSSSSSSLSTPSPSSSRTAAAAAARSSEALSSLKRIKHTLIGNTSRKLELASRRDDLSRIIGLLELTRYAASLDSRDLALHQISLQAADIIAAVAIARKECLSALLDLRTHKILLEQIEQLVKHVQEGQEDSIGSDRPSNDQSSRVYTSLMHLVRALKSFYVAIVSFVDPLGARAFTHILALSSAGPHLKTLALSSVTSASSSNTPSRSTTAPAKAMAAPGTLTTIDEELRIAQHADNMFLAEDAETIVRLVHCLYFGNGGLSTPQTYVPYPSQPSDYPGLLAPGAQQILASACDLIYSCLRTNAQREALHEAQETYRRASTEAGPSKGWDLYDLLDSLLHGSRELPSQLAEAIIRATTALVRDQDSRTKRGVRLYLSSPSSDTDGVWASMEERLSDRSRSMRVAAAEWYVVRYQNLRGLGTRKAFEIGPIVSVLLQNLHEPAPALSARAGFALACLVACNRDFQETACNMDALENIKLLLDKLSVPVQPYETVEAAAERSRQQQAALLATAALCMDIEELRRRVIDTQLLPHVISSLSSPFSNVRCAAAQCTRSLSRSINIIKTALLDTNAAPAFVELLSPAEDQLTQLATLAVVCNIFIEFSPLKTVLLEMEGLVERIVELTKVVKPAPRAGIAASPAKSANGKQSTVLRLKEAAGHDNEIKGLLRHHALMAIKNMTYWSSSDLKQKTAKCMTWEYIVTLLRDPDQVVRTEMLNILRNIACNDANDIDLVVRGIGEARLFSLIEEAFHTNRLETLLHSLYLVSNIATGTDAHKAAIMNRRGIIHAILTQMCHTSSEIRVAAVWAVINLCHRPEHRRYNENAARLRQLGFEARLKDMREDPSLDVRERVRDALEGGFDPDTPGPGMRVD